jgi:hypothetical protein
LRMLQGQRNHHQEETRLIIQKYCSYAPTILTLPCLTGLPRQTTLPARS